MVLCIQIFCIIIGFFSIIMVLYRFKIKLLTYGEFSLWCIFLILLCILIVFPELINKIIILFGISRGVDLFFYFALMLIFYLIFKIYLKIEKIEQEITIIVKEIALEKKKK